MSGCLKLDKGIGVWWGARQKEVRDRAARCAWRRDSGRVVRSGLDEEVGWAQLTEVCIPEPSVWPSY